MEQTTIVWIVVVVAIILLLVLLYAIGLPAEDDHILRINPSTPDPAGAPEPSIPPGQGYDWPKPPFSCMKASGPFATCPEGTRLFPYGGPAAVDPNYRTPGGKNAYYCCKVSPYGNMAPYPDVDAQILDRTTALSWDMQVIHNLKYRMPVDLYKFYGKMMIESLNETPGISRTYDYQSAQSCINYMISSHAGYHAIVNLLRKFTIGECIKDKGLLLVFLTQLAAKSREFIKKFAQATGCD